MAEVILMPRLSDTMTEGVIAEWHKQVGDQVKKGDLLAEIETDKATMELESYKDGTVLHLGGDKGGKLQVNDLLAIIGKDGEDVSTLIAEHEGKPEGEKKQEVEEKPAEKKQQESTPEKEPAAAAPQAKKEEGRDYSKMDEVVLMPRLSDTMTEGVIAAWLKNVGDDVKKGDILAEIETDKATMELESYKNGKLLYQGANTGEKILVNDLLCIIGKEDLDINSIVEGVKNSNAGGGDDDAEAPKEEASKEQEKPAVHAKDTAPQKVVNEGRIFASPLAKKMAGEKGIDLKYVKGSGDNGRITKSDIDNFKETAPTQAATNQQTPAPAMQKQAPAGEESFDEVPVSQMRKTIAKRLAESKFSAPHFYLTMSIDMDASVAAAEK